MTSKIKFLILSAVLLVAVSSCDQEPFRTYSKKYRHGGGKGNGNGGGCNDPKDSTGNNDPKDSVVTLPEFSTEMNVVLLPSQCDFNEVTEVVGLEYLGEYYYVSEDQSGKFSSLQPGQTANVHFSHIKDGCVFATSCDQPAPDHCISIIDLY